MTAQNFMNVVRFKLKSDCVDKYFEVIEKTNFEGMTQRYIAKTGNYDYCFVGIWKSAEADKRHSEFDIKPLFRGVSKEDPQKIIVIHQAPEGNVQKFVEANGDWMATHRVDLSTMEESSWTASLTKESCCD